MPNARTVVVLNPQSGGGRAARAAEGVRAALERALGPIEVQQTDREGHAIDLARDAALSGASLVVAVGGDGTLHEVANGVLDAAGAAPGVSIGYVGQGTGGDFRRSLGIEHRLDAYVAAIASGRTRKVDAGKLRYRDDAGEERTRWFVNILSAGMGGLVDRHVAGTSKALGGQLAYMVASARALIECRRGTLRCDVSLGADRRTRTLGAYVFAVCNGSYFGSGMHVAPMARVDDGRFEVVAMDAPSKVAFAAYSRRIYDGSHVGTRGVTHFACDRLAADLEGDEARGVFLLDVDGEPLGGMPIEVELVPGALTFRA